MKKSQKTKLTVLLPFAAIVASCGNKPRTNNAGCKTGTGASTEQPAQNDKKFPFEHGSYVEESNVMGMNVKKTVYFDRWGDWTAAENKMEMMGTAIDRMEIMKGSTHWNLDMVKKTGTTFQNNNVPITGMAAALGASMDGKIPEGMEVKELGEENYLGYKCRKTQTLNSKIKN